MSEWMPIETAPRSGEYILVYPPTWKDKAGSLASWYTDEWSKHPEPYFRRDDDHGKVFISKNMKPTHWMPLPDPPR